MITIGLRKPANGPVVSVRPWAGRDINDGYLAAGPLPPEEFETALPTMLPLTEPAEGLPS